MYLETDEKRIIVAMDYSRLKDAIVMAKRLDPTLCRLKVGKELFTVAGPAVIGELREMGFEIFLDLKYHDIPDTVAGAVRAAAELGVWMINVHALGGEKMLKAAVEAVGDIEKSERPLIIGVTMLTSMGPVDMKQVGISLVDKDGIEDSSLPMTRLAKLAQECGLDGVVCSGQEALSIRQVAGGDFMLVTPGIRLADSSANDQVRVVTPVDAIAAGADYLVIGRSITEAGNPSVALRLINESIKSI